jgi:hypothetical protein
VKVGVRSRKKERNESARSKRVEKQKEEREDLRKEVKELWDRDRRSMTLKVKHPLIYYMESNKRMLNYRNVRRRAEERVCAREARDCQREASGIPASTEPGAEAAGAKDVGWNLSRKAANAG